MFIFHLGLSCHCEFLQLQFKNVLTMMVRSVFWSRLAPIKIYFYNWSTFQKMSVPTLPPSSSSPLHTRVQLSRSVPSYHQHHSPSCPSSHNSKHIHRKLSRTAVPMSAAGDMVKIKQRRERARSASALVREEHHQHGGKRAKQDLNRSATNKIKHVNKKEWRSKDLFNISCYELEWIKWLYINDEQ